MPNGEWQFNWGYGDEHLWGWQYVLGSWSWGLVVTWHVSEAWNNYFWIGIVWQWNTFEDRWDDEHLQSIKEERGLDYVEPWMVHRHALL